MNLPELSGRNVISLFATKRENLLFSKNLVILDNLLPCPRLSVCPGNRHVKEPSFFNERYTNWVPFLFKMAYPRVTLDFIDNDRRVYTFLCLVVLLRRPLAASSYSLASWWCWDDSRLNKEHKGVGYSDGKKGCWEFR